DPLLRSRLCGVFHSIEAAPDQPGHVAQFKLAGVAEPLGRWRRFQGHVPAPGLSRLSMGRSAGWTRQLGLRALHVYTDLRRSAEFPFMGLRPRSSSRTNPDSIGM